MVNLKAQAAASNGIAAVLVGELGGKPVLVRYAPQSIGDFNRRDEFKALVNAALAKLGWKADRRAKCGYRKIA